MAGRLFLCATPIGNLKDITLRVLETLNSVDIVAAEDTRHTLRLLNYYDIKAHITSYHEHNKFEKSEALIKEMLEGKDVALVTDAGTPAISDPGEELVKAARASGIEVTSLPGPSAVVTALSLGTLSSRRFVFEGFLPRDKKERQAQLEKLKRETRTIVIYEAPHRLKKTLEELEGALGNREIEICRELTKVHEEVARTSLSAAGDYYREKEPRGEMVLLIKGADEEAVREPQFWEDMDIRAHVSFYMEQGIDEKEAMKMAAKDRNVSKREIYEELKI